MNSKLKKDLTIVAVWILAIIFIVGFIYLGSVMTPMIAIIVYLLGFNFILLPIFTINYYGLWESDIPSWKAFIPLYNATLTTSSGLAVASYITIVVNLIVGVLISNTWIFESLGDRWFFIVTDSLSLVVMITVSIYYLIAGICLAKPLLEVRYLYLMFFRDSDEISSGFARFLMNTGSITKYLEVLLLILPVLRVVPMYIGFNRIGELKRYNVSFYDFE